MWADDRLSSFEGQIPGAAGRLSTILDRYAEVRRRTEALCAPLSDEDQLLQSMPDASPAKWHLAHGSWFFETFLLAGQAAYEPFDPAFTYLFNSYYDGVGDRHPRASRGMLSRPSLAEVRAYRAHVDGAMLDLLGREALPLDLVELGLQHEQQHQELILMDIKHAFSLNPLKPAYAPSIEPTPAAVNAGGWTSRPGGLVEIGDRGEGFCFDNEGPRHKQWIEPYRLANRLVTAGEWQDFIADGGYRTPTLWLSEGWATVEREGWVAPLYWEQREGAWELFTLTGAKPVGPAEPVVHVSFFEADAFARWAGMRLPTEAEWEDAASAIAPDAAAPFGLHPAPASEDGLTQLFGAAWQWTASPYVAYPRYRPAAGAVGEYNGKFMSGQMVLRGSACVTPPGHERLSYRNFFPPAARWAFSGVRLAADA